MLIDGGGPETAASLLDYLKDSHVEQLDYILVTSYDEDHLAGVVEVLGDSPGFHAFISTAQRRRGRAV